MQCIRLRRSHHTTQRGFWDTDCGGITRIWFFYRCLQCSPPALVSNLFHTSDLSKRFFHALLSVASLSSQLVFRQRLRSVAKLEKQYILFYTNHVNCLKLKQQFHHVIYLLIFHWNKPPFLFTPKKRVEGLTYPSCYLLPLLKPVKRFLALHSGQYSFYRQAADFYDPALPPGFLP